MLKYCLLGILSFAAFSSGAQALSSQKKIFDQGTYSVICQGREDSDQAYDVKVDGWFKVDLVNDKSTYDHVEAEGNAEARFDIKIMDGSQEIYEEKNDKLSGTYVVNVGQLDADADENEVRLENRSLLLTIVFYEKQDPEIWITYRQREINLAGCLVRRD